MHQHKCSLCGTIWQHGEESDRDMQAHECLACGCHQFRLYIKRDPGEQSTAAAQTLSTLVEALGNANPFVRSTTIFSLVACHPVPQGVLQKLAEAATGDKEPMVRLAAVETLRRFGKDSSPAVPAIARALADPHPDVRRAAAMTLGDLGATDQSYLVALTSLLGDKNLRVREAAVAALRRLQPTPRACNVIVVCQGPAQS
jgi:predicted  nucleic acid-binding Zn-ribbon protein